MLHSAALKHSFVVAGLVELWSTTVSQRPQVDVDSHA